MAGARVELVTDTATPAVQQAARELAGDAVRLMLSDIGEYLVRATRARADRQVDPDGNTWKALSPRYKRFKDRKRPGLPILRFDRHMLGDQFTFQVNGNELAVGTNAKYGAAHQFGADIDIAPRSQEVFFRRGRGGEVGNRFVPRKKSNFAQRVTLPRYQVHIPARPFLGVSAEDEIEIKAIALDHLQGLFNTGA